MPLFDLTCAACEVHFTDVLVRTEWPACPGCGHPFAKTISVPAIRTDRKYRGGMVIRNLGPRPVTVYSEQDRQRRMKQAGLHEVD